MDNQQCIFCGIANGGVPSKKIYEDDKVTIVLDIYPANPAHLLVLTKQHYAIFNQLSKDAVEHLALICKRISEMMFSILKPEGINFFIANGAAAGQKAPHMILHAIPRFSGDGLRFELPYTTVDEKELDSYYDKLKGTLKNYFPNVDFDSAPTNAENEEGPEEEQEKEQANPEKTEEKPKDAGETKEDNEPEPKKESVPEQKEGNMAEQKIQKSESKKDDDINLDRITEMFS